MDMEAQLVKKALVVHSSQTDDSSGDKVLKKRSAEQIQQPVRLNLGASLNDVFIFIVKLIRNFLLAKGVMGIFYL